MWYTWCMDNKTNDLALRINPQDKYRRGDVLSADGVAMRLYAISGEEISHEDIESLLVAPQKGVTFHNKFPGRKIDHVWFTTWGAVVDYIGGA